jgi:hypothetical protein
MQSGRLFRGAIMIRDSVVEVRFAMGTVTVAPEVRQRVADDELWDALVRHGQEDWGDLDEREWKANDEALEYGGMIRSSYLIGSVPILIITELEHPRTTVRLASTSQDGPRG